jgi:dienelactone hydrolase
MLEPHVQVFGPADDEPRPAVLLFHGCGGVREHTSRYAHTAAEAGMRAFVVDSYAARGWTRAFGLAFVCSGLAFRGSERTGDLVAAAWGVGRRPDVRADRLAMAGWSHGSWAIMDLMTMPLTDPGEAGLADATPEPLAGLKSVYLGYPYGGLGALSRTRPWVRTPRTVGVLCEKDHVTSVADADRIYTTVRKAGGELEVWRVPATHAFDEPGTNGLMRYDEKLSIEAHERFRRLLVDTLGPVAALPARRSA